MTVFVARELDLSKGMCRVIRIECLPVTLPQNCALC